MGGAALLETAGCLGSILAGGRGLLPGAEPPGLPGRTRRLGPARLADWFLSALLTLTNMAALEPGAGCHL